MVQRFTLSGAGSLVAPLPSRPARMPIGAPNTMLKAGTGKRPQRPHAGARTHPRQAIPLDEGDEIVLKQF